MVEANIRILTIHNKYKFRGGEDESREAEDTLMESMGHQVHQLIFDNSVIQPGNTILVGIQASWNQRSYNVVSDVIRSWRPDVVDVHNFFPIASPAIHYAARRLDVPVVQTLHNYRLLCPGSYFLREGRVCEDCTRYPIPIPGVIHGCYRGSSVQTGAVALMLTLHRGLRTWERLVSIFIAVSEFEKRKFVEHGFPAKKIMVKPNFLMNHGVAGCGGEEFLFVGRLSPEKGLETLLRAVELAKAPIVLNIVGDGPLRDWIQTAAQRNPRIRYLGVRPQQEVLTLMGNAKCLVVPSEWYETFGRVVVESFSQGTPVISSRIGALEELVSDGKTGFFFLPGDAMDLARVMTLAYDHAELSAGMRQQARREYESKYTPQINYDNLTAIYSRAMGKS